MRFWATALAAVLAVGIIGAGDASGAAKPEKKKKGDKAGGGTAGTITRIEGKAPAVTLTVSAGRGNRAKEVTVTTDAGTSVTVDGQAKSVADLRVGERVKLDAATGKVKSIEASTAAPRKGDGKKPGEKKRKKKKAA